MIKRLFIVGAAVTSAAAWAGFVAARTLWRTWGVDPDEAARSLPGDDLVAEPSAVDTRGVDLAAPPEKVWPWLVQMGYGRAGWYSYDQLDMDHPSLDRIDPALQALAVGDILPTHPGGGFEVKVLEPERTLVAYSDRALVETQAAAGTGGGIETAPANLRATGATLDRAMSGEFAASWAFVLEPKDGATRLVERFRIRVEPGTRRGRATAIPPFVFRMLGFGVFVMLRRQMLGIRDRVEGRPIRRRIRPNLWTTPSAQPG